MATALHYTIRRFSVVTIHFICFAGARGCPRFTVHWTKPRTLCGHTRLSRTKRSDRRDDQRENQDGRLNAEHIIQNGTLSVVLVPTVRAELAQ
jgi:hypothetical protein